MASIADQVYEYLINNGSSPEAARTQADRVERTQSRQAATTPAIFGGPASLSGMAPAGLRLARQIFGGSKLVEGGQQYLPRPDRGNARLPEEMLQPTLPAPSAPQFLPPSRSLERLEYSPAARPPRDDRMRRFEGEGGMTDDAVQMARDVHNRRVAQERDLKQMEMDRMVGEGGREGRSFSRDFTFEGPSYYPYPPPVRFNQAGIPVSGGRPAANDMPLFTQVEGAGPSLSYSPRNSGAMMERPASDMVPPPRLVGAQGASESTGPFFGAGSVNLETMLARPNVQRMLYSTGTAETGPGQGGPTSNAPAMTPADLFDMRAPAMTPADLFDMRGDHPLPPPRPAGLGAAPAPQRAAAPAPRSVVTTPPPAEGNDSILSRIFSGKDYQSARGQVEQATPEGRKAINWGDPESAADFFRADKAMRGAKERGEDFTGMATGGAAKPHKDASLHKALEIIHSLISSR